ncbi:hypothetical protein SAMN04488021_1198 [Paracoccus aminovorans]|uniref:Uncharacterized protein n=1 Tax=Paracoccus aminovorans TaxID=34004 RepID=A0A1I3B379_9RHOB|nr:hypothetical protein SAMN04488021_1198 [Paracoccus aminovorans]
MLQRSAARTASAMPRDEVSAPARPARRPNSSNERHRAFHAHRSLQGSRRKSRECRRYSAAKACPLARPLRFPRDCAGRRPRPRIHLKARARTPKRHRPQARSHAIARCGDLAPAPSGAWRFRHHRTASLSGAASPKAVEKHRPIACTFRRRAVAGGCEFILYTVYCLWQPCCCPYPKFSPARKNLGNLLKSCAFPAQDSLGCCGPGLRPHAFSRAQRAAGSRRPDPAGSRRFSPAC